MPPNFVVVVNAIMPMRRHIGSSMPNLHNFVLEIVALLELMTDKWV